MNKLIIIIFVCSILMLVTSPLQAQEAEKPTHADSTIYVIDDLFYPSFQTTGYYNGLTSVKYAARQELQFPFLFHISAALVKGQVTDDAFDIIPNYIYSRSVFEYEFKLERRKWYPDNFLFYRDNSPSLLSLFN